MPYASYNGCRMTADASNIAVMTGDLVNSGQLGEDNIARAFAELEKCADQQAQWYGTPLHFTRHRGDGWQVVLYQPMNAVRTALAFRAALKALGDAFDSYIGIAEGPVAHEVGPDLNQETAEVFVKSGEALEELKATKTTVRMVHDSLGMIDAAIIFADRLAQDWTPAQAQAIAMMLGPDGPITYSETADKLGKSRQAVTKALKAAGIDHLTLALETIDRRAAG